MSTDNKIVIRTFIEEVINQGRLERTDEFVIEDFVELDPFPGQAPGREGLKAVILQMRSAFPDIHWAVDEMVAEGDKLVTRFTWTGTHQGEFLGVSATGRPVSIKGIVVDTLEGGKMVDSRMLLDVLGMMMQLGMTLGPGEN